MFKNMQKFLFSSPGNHLPVCNSSSRAVAAVVVKRHRQGKVYKWGSWFYQTTSNVLHRAIVWIGSKPPSLLLITDMEKGLCTPDKFMPKQICLLSPTILGGLIKLPFPPICLALSKVSTSWIFHIELFCDE